MWAKWGLPAIRTELLGILWLAYIKRKKHSFILCKKVLVITKSICQPTDTYTLLEQWWTVSPCRVYTHDKQFPDLSTGWNWAADHFYPGLLFCSPCGTLGWSLSRPDFSYHVGPYGKTGRWSSISSASLKSYKTEVILCFQISSRSHTKSHIITAPQTKTPYTWPSLTGKQWQLYSFRHDKTNLFFVPLISDSLTTRELCTCWEHKDSILHLNTSFF